MVFLGQFDSQTGTLIARLLATDFRMMLHFWVVTILRLGLRHVAIDDVRILTVHHNGKTG